MKLEELEVGKSYTRGDDAEYMVLYVFENFAVVLHYSYNHKIGCLEFWNQQTLDEDYNQKLYQMADIEWPLINYISEFKYIDDNTIAYE